MVYHVKYPILCGLSAFTVKDPLLEAESVRWHAQRAASMCMSPRAWGGWWCTVPISLYVVIVNHLLATMWCFCLVKSIVVKYELQLTLQYISFLLASKHIQHISSHGYIVWVPYTLIQDQVSKYLGISLPFLEIMSSNNLFVVQSSKYYIMKRRVSTLKLQYVTIERYRSILF